MSYKKYDDILTSKLPIDKSPIIVSACLLGVNCKYDSSNNRSVEILSLLKHRQLIPVCPEILGGLPTPRDPQNIIEGNGSDVLDYKTKVINTRNVDVTNNFVLGARETLKIAKLYSAKYAVLKERSPACGVKSIYNIINNYKELVSGFGVTAALLKKNGVIIYSEEDFKELKD